MPAPEDARVSWEELSEAFKRLHETAMAAIRYAAESKDPDRYRQALEAVELSYHLGTFVEVERDNGEPR